MLRHSASPGMMRVCLGFSNSFGNIDNAGTSSMSKMGTKKVIPRDLVLFTVFTWLWLVSAPVFWHLANAKQILLPTLPGMVWKIPGVLWQVSPLGLIALMLILPAGYHLLQLKPPLRRILRLPLIASAAALAIISVFWGSILLASL